MFTNLAIVMFGALRIKLFFLANVLHSSIQKLCIKKLELQKLKTNFFLIWNLIPERSNHVPKSEPNFSIRGFE